MSPENSSLSFRQSIASAPEFNQPYVHNSRIWGELRWPISKVVDKDHIVVFEASGQASEDSPPSIVRISYEAPYGLKVKRTIFLRKYADLDEPTMEAAYVRYTFGAIDINLVVNPRSPLIIPGKEDEPESFYPLISITKGDDTPPHLATVEYQNNSKVPVSAKFLHADYSDALEGKFETRQEKGFAGPSYRENYFTWEHLTGAHVGMTAYDDPEYKDDLNYHGSRAEVNSRTPVQIDGSPYKQKISWSRGSDYWGGGRLRFGRINMETRESWMLSVPDWIDNYKFHHDVQHSPLQELSWQYPVVFCVKKPGEERQWSSTWVTNDKARRS